MKLGAAPNSNKSGMLWNLTTLLNKKPNYDKTDRSLWPKPLEKPKMLLNFSFWNLDEGFATIAPTI